MPRSEKRIYLMAGQFLKKKWCIAAPARRSYSPSGAPMQGVSESEVRELVASHREPLRMYSNGVAICRLRFTFLKMEGKNIILLRRPDAKCAVGFANTGAQATETGTCLYL